MCKLYAKIIQFNLFDIYVSIYIYGKNNLPMAKKQSIPTVMKIFSTNDGLDLASMNLQIQNNNN